MLINIAFKICKKSRIHLLLQKKIMEFLFLAIGLIFGFLLGWLLLRVQKSNQKANVELRFSEMQKEKDMAFALLDKEKGIIDDRYIKLSEQYAVIEENLNAERNKVGLSIVTIAKLESDKANMLEKLTTQKSETEDLRTKFKIEFENIANSILKTHSKEFTDINVKNIGDILNPLKEKIGDFEKKVNEAYDKELRDKISLREEVKKLVELNIRVSEDATNLTKALKGDSKKQGNWGEMVLERILERSGLTKGQEYEVQVSSTNDDGRRVQPDVVVMLPDKKHIIIDAKVSLTAYENLVNAATDEERQIFIKEHILSIRRHIKELSEKSYQTAQGFNSPDFVLMFIPIESSFGIAVQADQQIFSDAWDNRIVIVSPSTLLATLKTISSIWKQENQTKNAIEIAKQGGALYDKFVGFVADMKKMGDNILKTQGSYNEAMNKLASGNGNLITRAENIRKLGAKTSKLLQEEFTTSNETLFPNENS